MASAEEPGRDAQVCGRDRGSDSYRKAKMVLKSFTFMKR
jgi:hypothetical protein